MKVECASGYCRMGKITLNIYKKQDKMHKSGVFENKY